jgi:hypothetical protein
MDVVCCMLRCEMPVQSVIVHEISVAELLIFCWDNTRLIWHTSVFFLYIRRRYMQIYASLDPGRHLWVFKNMFKIKYGFCSACIQIWLQLSTKEQAALIKMFSNTQSVQYLYFSNILIWNLDANMATLLHLRSLCFQNRPPPPSQSTVIISIPDKNDVPGQGFECFGLFF